jgi:hypothetical protein
MKNVHRKVTASEMEGCVCLVIVSVPLATEYVAAYKIKTWPWAGEKMNRLGCLRAVWV